MKLTWFEEIFEEYKKQILPSITEKSVIDLLI